LRLERDKEGFFGDDESSSGFVVNLGMVIILQVGFD
jgi:hypothetical protein